MLLVLQDKQSLSSSQVASQALLVVLSITGVWMLAKRRRLLGWIGTAAGVAVLYLLAASTTHGVAGIVTLPWYSSSERVAANFIYFIPVFAAMPISELWNWVRARGLQVAGAVAILGIAVVSGGGLVDAFRTDATYRSAVRPEQMNAYEFLDERGRGAPIFTNPEIDGAIWMYPTEGLRPLVISDLDADGVELIRNAAQGDSAALHELTDGKGVQLALVSDTGFPTGIRWVTPRDLEDNPWFVEIWSEGSAHVYRISEP